MHTAVSLLGGYRWGKKIDAALTQSPGSHIQYILLSKIVEMFSALLL
jgi:hypothetical protein